MPAPAFVTITEAAAALRVTRKTVRLRLRRLNITPSRNASDQREKLISRRDLLRLAARRIPVPVRRHPQESPR